MNARKLIYGLVAGALCLVAPINSQPAAACKQDATSPCRPGIVATCGSQCAPGVSGCVILPVYVAIGSRPWCEDAASGDTVCVNTPLVYFCYQKRNCDSDGVTCPSDPSKKLCTDDEQEPVGPEHWSYGSMQNDNNCP